MKTIKFLILLTAFAFVTISCHKNDDDDNTIEKVNLDIKKITDLYAPEESDYTKNPPTYSGEFVKFSFKKGGTTTGDDWDIAFRGTTILVNGGTSTNLTSEPARTGKAQLYIAKGDFANVKEVNTSLLMSDDTTKGLAATISPNGKWYTYDQTKHTISATAGKIIVVKTHDDKYAKMEILSYYKAKEPRYYTFNYVYQPNGTTKF